MPDLDALRLLDAVGRTGSIGGAARAVGTTQQSASERLRSVEGTVGLPLVRRGPRGSELTDAGVVVAGWGRRLLDLADEIDLAIDGLRGDRDRGLTVWASMTVAEGLLPRWLVLLRQRRSADGLAPTAVRFTAANSTQVAAAVRDGTADLGFVEGAAPPAGLRSTVVAHDELVLVAAPGDPLARRRTPVEPAEVAALTTTGREPGSGTRAVLERALRRHRLEPRVAVELTTATAVREAVAAGGPPAVLGARAVARDLAEGRLVRVPVAGLDLRRAFRAVWSGSAQPPAGPVRQLVGIAREDVG
ncbi:LysR family transcriptional regulator [Lapillicoccus jejuensis]